MTMEEVTNKFLAALAEKDAQIAKQNENMAREQEALDKLMKRLDESGPPVDLHSATGGGGSMVQVVLDIVLHTFQHVVMQK